MEEMIEGNPFEEKKRPQFLKALCILSFIAAAFGIIGGIMSMSKNQDEDMEKLQQLTESMQESGESSGIMTTIMEGSIAMMEHKKELDLLAFAVTLLSLLGVLMMWNLKKNGFWFYTAAQILSLIGTFVILGVSFMSIVTIGFGGFFSILFIVLYAMNLKHMS